MAAPNVCTSDADTLVCACVIRRRACCCSRRDWVDADAKVAPRTSERARRSVTKTTEAAARNVSDATAVATFFLRSVSVGASVLSIPASDLNFLNRVDLSTRCNPLRETVSTVVGQWLGLVTT